VTTSALTQYIAAEPGDRRQIERDAGSSEVLTVDEAAEFLRIGRNQLYDAIGRGDVPHRRIGKVIRLSRSALVRWLGGSCGVAEQELT